MRVFNIEQHIYDKILLICIFDIISQSLFYINLSISTQLSLDKRIGINLMQIETGRKVVI